MKLEVFRGAHHHVKAPETCSDAETSVPSPLSIEDELGSDGDCAAHSPCAPAASLAISPGSACSESKDKNKPYTRRPKPPYSYIALIAMAIRDSNSGRLTLAEINDYLMRKFPFFRGSYTGWRNSVRHNLSLNDCFLKVLRDPSRPWGKDNYWMLNPHSEYTFADGVFRRRRKRIAKKPGREPDDITPGDSPSSIHASASSSTKFTSPFAIDSILSRPFKGNDHQHQHHHHQQQPRTTDDVQTNVWSYVTRGVPVQALRAYGMMGVTFEDIAIRHQRDTVGTECLPLARFSPATAHAQNTSSKNGGLHSFQIDYLLS